MHTIMDKKKGFFLLSSCIIGLENVVKSIRMSRYAGEEILIRLPSNENVYGLVSVLVTKAPTLLHLMSEGSKEVDLSSSGLVSNALKAVIYYIHKDSLDSESDLMVLLSMLKAADYCGAEECKVCIEKQIIKDHLSALEPDDLRRLTEDARGQNAEMLYQAAGKELADRAPLHVLAAADSFVLADLVQKRKQRQELVIGTESGRVLFYNAATGSLLKKLEKAHSDLVTCVAYSIDASLLATSSNDLSIRLFCENICIRVFEKCHTRSITQVAFSGHGTIVLASISTDFRCKIWNISNGDCLKVLHHTTFLWSLAYSPRIATQLATGANDYIIRLWMTDTDCFQPLKGHKSPIMSLAFAPDGMTLVSGGGSCCILWDPATAIKLRTFDTVPEVTKVLFSPTGISIASASNFASGASIHLWHGYTGACLTQLKLNSLADHYTLDYSTLAYSPDSSTIACGCYRGSQWKVAIWELKTFHCVRTFDIDGPFMGFAYRPCL